MKYVYFYAKFWWINTFLAPVTARIHGSAALSAGLGAGLSAGLSAGLGAGLGAELSAGLGAGLSSGLEDGLACGLLADSRARLSDLWLAGLLA